MILSDRDSQEKKGTLRITSDHRVLSEGQWKEINSIAKDRIKVRRWNHEVSIKEAKLTKVIKDNKKLKSLVIGTLLGDSSFSQDRMPRLALMQSESQIEYLNYKKNVLESYGLAFGKGHTEYQDMAQK